MAVSKYICLGRDDFTSNTFCRETTVVDLGNYPFDDDAAPTVARMNQGLHGLGDS